ncbi:hypothetical protein BRD01_09420 [Halobacteriales archaeon QS_8_65_32]|jgi:hypothetical protein|nr:MAG: hypothetical protein BRD01_09420 [Halobacteriales archaeon QS_8_65_32]
MAEYDSRNASGRRSAERAEASGTSGYGISITLIGGVLLALSYYAVTAFRSGQLSALSLPEPFYLLAVAFLFVLELLKSRHKGFIALVRATLFAAVFGALCVLGVEGAIYLVGSPAAALNEFAGVTVLSVALVVAALGYFTYLSIVQFDRRKRVGA